MGGPQWPSELATGRYTCLSQIPEMQLAIDEINNSSTVLAGLILELLSYDYAGNASLVVPGSNPYHAQRFLAETPGKFSSAVLATGAVAEALLHGADVVFIADSVVAEDMLPIVENALALEVL